MTDLVVSNGRVVTQNDRRRVIPDGAVAVSDGEITQVGPTAEVKAAVTADREIDANGGAVIPGLINTHTHVSDILLRGTGTGDRGLYDWLFNIKQPGVFEMEPEEHALAARLYCLETISSGTTTFVENDTALNWDSPATTRHKLDVYREMGVRSVYGAGIRDRPVDDGFKSKFEDIRARPPASNHPGPDVLVRDTESVLSAVDSLIREYHDPTSRQSVWPAPATVATVTTEGLRGAYRLAETHDVMTTTHTAESEAEARERGALSTVEYLRNIGYLGDRALLGHCVQTDARDVRMLARSDTRVAHNYRANMLLGTGFAPIVAMREAGMTVGIGTDNPMLNDTIDALTDADMAHAAHNGFHRDPGALTAQDAFDMITRDGAAAIGRADDLGSLAVGKRADIVIVSFDGPHLVLSPDPVHTLIYGANHGDVKTVIIDGEVVMTEGDLGTILENPDAVLAEARETAVDLAERAGLK